MNLPKFNFNFTRWFKSWNINLTSESKERNVMRENLENMAVRAEEVPFTFKTKRGDHVVRPAPLAYCTDLVATIFHLLDEKARLVTSL